MTGEVIDRLVEPSVPAILEMMGRAEEFTCQVAEADFGAECNFNREQYVAGLGGVTVWSGMDFDGRKAVPIRKMMRSCCCGVSSPSCRYSTTSLFILIIRRT